MKNFTRSLLALALLGCFTASAQQPASMPVRTTPITRRCATEDVIARRMQDPAYRARMEARMAQVNNLAARTSTLTGPVTIPVVVHVVLPFAYIITEKQVDALLTQLNLDFSGLNPDSTNAGTAFTPLRGHSLIRFARARRDPNGQLTSGIERTYTAGLEITGDTYQPIKHTSDGGLDPWDVNQYYNIWVGDGGSAGLLGIAPCIGQGNATEADGDDVGIDGVCIDYAAFSNGCFSDASYNRGRTVTHEIGHNFGLYHIFSGCAVGADFQQTMNGAIPTAFTGAAADDTPGQGTQTTNCPTGTVNSPGCTTAQAPNPPGKMYQNYMDYTFDACYSMFTKGQVNRMHAILELYRPGYLTTQGHIPPAGSIALDAAPSRFINPGGILFNDAAANCTTTGFSLPICPGALAPRVEIVNRGTTNLTSVTVSAQVNGGTAVTTTVNSLNVATGASTVVTLPSVTLIDGVNVIKVTTSAPNGGTDGNTANDAITYTLNLGKVNAPLIENFDAASTQYNIGNLHGDVTWQRINVATGPAGTPTGVIAMDNYNNGNVGTTDEIRFVPVNLIAGADSMLITFDLAHKPYVGTDGTVIADTLNVLVTNTCSSPYTRVYQKAGATLATAGNSNAAYLSPATSDWRRERIAVSTVNAVATGTVEVVIQNKTNFGNNIFLDNVNITSSCKTSTFSTQPAATQAVCLGSAATFTSAATGTGITYQWYKGSSPITGATSATYPIPAVTAADAGTYYVVVKNVCGVSVQSSNSVLTVTTGGACTTAVANIDADINNTVLMPNTIHSSATLRVTVARATKIDWTVTDAQGRVVKRFQQTATPGQNDFGFDASGLARGSYQLSGTTQKGNTPVLKFVRL